MSVLRQLQFNPLTGLIRRWDWICSHIVSPLLTVAGHASHVDVWPYEHVLQRLAGAADAAVLRAIYADNAELIYGDHISRGYASVRNTLEPWYELVLSDTVALVSPAVYTAHEVCLAVERWAMTCLVA